MPKVASITKSNIFKYPVHIWVGDVISTSKEFHVSIDKNQCVCPDIKCYDCPKLCMKSDIIEYLVETHPNLKVTNPELFI